MTNAAIILLLRYIDAVAVIDWLKLSGFSRYPRCARAACATIVFEPTDEDHGGRRYSCHAPEVHLWNFGSYDRWV